MKRYCFDTSGISNPVENLPDDIYEPIWHGVIRVIESGAIAVTTEIYDELHGSIRGLVGACIDANRANLLLEIDDDSWDYGAYAAIVTAMQLRHHDFIREYTGGSKRTVGLADISIVALAKTLKLPVVSMERSAGNSPKHKKIPDVCALEQVEHLDFNTFLRREKIGFPQA
jgi:hypothetical protein